MSTPKLPLFNPSKPLPSIETTTGRNAGAQGATSVPSPPANAGRVTGHWTALKHKLTTPKPERPVKATAAVPPGSGPRTQPACQPSEPETPAFRTPDLGASQLQHVAELSDDEISAMPDEQVIDQLRDLARQPTELNGQPLADAGRLLKSRNMATLSAATLVELHMAAHLLDGRLSIQEERERAVFAKLDEAFKQRIVVADAKDRGSIRNLAREITRSSADDRKLIAHALGSMRPETTVQLLFALDPQEFSKVDDPIVDTLMRQLASINLDSFTYLEQRFEDHLTPAAQGKVQKALFDNSEGIQLRLMKDSLDLIVSGIQRKDPDRVSNGVAHAMRAQREFQALTQMPQPSEKERNATIKSLMAQALRDSEAKPTAAFALSSQWTLPTLKAEINGLEAGQDAKGKPVVVKVENAVSKVAKDKLPKDPELRQQALDVKLVLDAVNAASGMRRSA